MTRHVVAGTAGHIDHGKSTLVRALTGTDPDRLKEEKLRGITIDLGFAHLDLGDAQVAFVDVPGHERFVKNMLAGAGGIDLVVLVVAADESVMPQTREHFDICRLLGVAAGVVVVTKTDLVESAMLDLVREDVADLVRGSFLEGAGVVAVSARTGDGLPELREALRRLALAAPPRSTDRPFRLPIDRAFSVRGFGTVVTGTLTAGRIEKDQEIQLLPGGRTARIRGLQVHGSASDQAEAGQRTAVNLQGLDLDQVGRGMVLVPPRRFAPTRMLDVRIDLLPTAPHALRNLVKVRFHQGTAEVLARVALLGPDRLEPGKSAYAQLRLDREIFALGRDPFIVRQFSPALTIGGGLVLDPLPTKHKSTDGRAAAALERFDREPMASGIEVLVAASPTGTTTVADINARLGLPDERLAETCREESRAGRLVMLPGPNPLLLLPETLAVLERDTVRHVTRFHEESPLQRGMPREELRARVSRRLPPEVFAFCLHGLERARVLEVKGDLVALHGRDVRLDAGDDRIRSRIEEAFARAHFQPPLLSELGAALGLPEPEVRRIYFWMLEQRLLVRITDDMAYPNAILDAMKAAIRRAYPPGTRFGVAEFKEIFDLTRKHAIPLLEFLDRERFTRRQGNDRVVL